jgi:hypothetical protein
VVGECSRQGAPCRVGPPVESRGCATSRGGTVALLKGGSSIGGLTPFEGAFGPLDISHDFFDPQRRAGRTHTTKSYNTCSYQIGQQRDAYDPVIPPPS